VASCGLNEPARCASAPAAFPRRLRPTMPAIPTLIAEKPSYSRGPDGRYPFGVASFQQTLGELKKQTLATSTMAQTMGRRADAPRTYHAAHSSFTEIDAVRNQESGYRKRQEDNRQEEERINLSKAYKIEKQRFEAEWASRIEEVERDCEEKERVLKEVHEIAKAAVEKDIATRIGKMRYKGSSVLLGMEDTERKLANANEFREAAEVAARCNKQRIFELAEFERTKALAGGRPRNICETTQAAEMRNLIQKSHSLRMTVRREKDEAFKVFKQKYRNLEADLSHAHAIEYSLRAEVGPVQTNKARSTQSSTFRGTLKYESLAGTKFDVPDVSMLEPIPAEALKFRPGDPLI